MIWLLFLGFMSLAGADKPFSCCPPRSFSYDIRAVTGVHNNSMVSVFYALGSFSWDSVSELIGLNYSVMGEYAPIPSSGNPIREVLDFPAHRAYVILDQIGWCEYYPLPESFPNGCAGAKYGVPQVDSVIVASSTKAGVFQLSADTANYSVKGSAYVEMDKSCAFITDELQVSIVGEPAEDIDIAYWNYSPNREISGIFNIPSSCAPGKPEKRLNMLSKVFAI